MAVTAAIVINQSGKPSGSPSSSRDDLDLGALVTLSNNDDTGVTSWLWEFISKPPSSSAVLGTPTSSTSSFTPDIRGSYFIRLTVTDGGSSIDTDERIAAVKTSYLSVRVPAAEEETEFDATLGWATAMHAALLAIDTDASTNLKKDGSNTPTQNIPWGSKKITGLADPDDPQDAATKSYVDSNAAPHAIGGSQHTTSTLAELNTKISDATLIDTTDSRLSDARTPTGTASGDLSGTYPSPTVSKIKGLDVAGTPIDNQVMIYKSSSGDIEWETATFDGYNFKVSDDDTTPGFVEDKFIAGPNVDFTTLDGGGDESFQISVDLDAYATVTNLTNHTSDLTNPHQVTLDQAYSEGGTITIDSGPMDLNASGNWALDIDGYVGFREISSDPTVESNVGFLYVKDDSGDTELFYKDASDNVVQITIDGYINAGALSGGNTLDQAYDEGGAGSGRIITVDSGPILLNVSGDDSGLSLQATGNLDGNPILDVGITSDSDAQSGAWFQLITDGYYEPKNIISDLVVSLPTGGSYTAVGITSDLRPLPSNPADTTIKSFKAEIFAEDTPRDGLFVAYDVVNSGGMFASFHYALRADEGSVKLESGDLFLDDGYLSLGEQTDPSPNDDTGFVYVKDIDGYSELFYMDNYGSITQLTDDGYLAGSSNAAQDNLDSTGTETYVALSYTPLISLDTDSGRDLQFYRNGILLRWISSLTADINRWTYNSSLNRVEFPASGSSDWYTAIYNRR